MQEATDKGCQVAREFAKRLRSSLGSAVRHVYCFGSWARGSAAEDSDVDLLVETHTPVTGELRDCIVDIVMDLSAESGQVLDVHYYTTGELKSPRYAGTPFVKAVLGEAILL
jgi:predicted nucleotidyltransferase